MYDVGDTMPKKLLPLPTSASLSCCHPSCCLHSLSPPSHLCHPQLCPLTCLAPSQHAATIPDAYHMPFMCPSPSHDLMHAPWPPSMCPDAFQCTPPLINALPPSQSCPTCPSCAPAPATTSRTRCGPLQCVLTHFNTPHPLSMCCRHPRRVPRALHVPQPQP